MPEYSNISQSRLDTCDVDLQDVFTLAIEIFDCSILEGYRGEEKQNGYFTRGLSKIKFPHGKHNKIPSEAVDAAPYPVVWVSKEALLRSIADHNRGELFSRLNELLRWYHFAGIVKGIGHAKGIDIRWGGDWDGDFSFIDQDFDDLPHFEVIKK